VKDTYNNSDTYKEQYTEWRRIFEEQVPSWKIIIFEN
jgi:hypothetical protein